MFQWNKIRCSCCNTAVRVIKVRHHTCFALCTCCAGVPENLTTICTRQRSLKTWNSYFLCTLPLEGCIFFKDLCVYIYIYIYRVHPSFEGAQPQQSQGLTISKPSPCCHLLEHGRKGVWPWLSLKSMTKALSCIDKTIPTKVMSRGSGHWQDLRLLKARLQGNSNKRLGEKVITRQPQRGEQGDWVSKTPHPQGRVSSREFSNTFPIISDPTISIFGGRGVLSPPLNAR